MGTPTTQRRWRINRGFGQSPRFVLATSALQSRLIFWRLRQVTP